MVICKLLLIEYCLEEIPFFFTKRTQRIGLEIHGMKELSFTNDTAKNQLDRIRVSLTFNKSRIAGKL